MAGGLLTLTRNATAQNQVTLEGTIVSHTEDPVPNARIAVSSNAFTYVRTDENGYFSAEVPYGNRVYLGFYKSSENAFLAHRLDGVPHILTLPTITVGSDGYDLGEYPLPEAHTLDARAVFANRPGGVEDAIPRFGSSRNGLIFASGYSYTTTNENGYMKLKGADFTGVEMAGETRVWMYPPTFEPYTDQRTADYAPYETVDVTTLEVTEDTTIECDISRRNGNGKRKGKNNGR
jgi:hypothetical protein